VPHRYKSGELQPEPVCSLIDSCACTLLEGTAMFHSNDGYHNKIKKN
jgi:hypothetical protein